MMYAVTVVTSLLTMIALAATVTAFGSAGIVQGAVLGLILYVGLQGTATYVGRTVEGSSMALWRINALYNLVIFVVMGAVFAAW